MRILLVSSIFPPGGEGAAVVYHQLCKHLNKEMIALVPTASSGNVHDFDALQSFRVFRVPYLRGRARAQCKPTALRKWANIAARLLPRVPLACFLMRYMCQFKPDIVCIGSLKNLYWIAPLCRFMGPAAVVFYIHGEEIFGFQINRIGVALVF